jgi:hypothetical protein
VWQKVDGFRVNRAHLADHSHLESEHNSMAAACRIFHAGLELIDFVAPQLSPTKARICWPLHFLEQSVLPLQ